MTLIEMLNKVLAIANEFGGDMPVEYDLGHSLVDVYYDQDAGKVKLAYQWPEGS